MTDFTQYVKANQTRFIEELQDLVRIPSISTDPEHVEDIARAADWIADSLRKLGLTAEIVQTERHPAVLAELNVRSDAPTVMIYGHYDVQPARTEDGWSREPFAAQVEGEILYGRGSADNKGQIFSHIKGLETYLNTKGNPPVNVRFLIEGEEEIGSPNLETLIQERKAGLSPDVVLVSDTAMFQEDTPTICYGLRGLAAAEITVYGANRDLHSGSYGGAVVNPLHTLTGILGALHDRSGRVTVPGFYDDVEPLQEWERGAWDALPWDDKILCSELDVESLWGEEGYTTLERCWGRPTLEINGCWGGFTGKGTKTVIPRKASAKITFRLVPNQSPTRVLDRFEQYVRSFPLDGGRIEIARQAEGNPVRFDAKGPAVEAAKRSLVRAFGKEPVLIREGGSIPIVAAFDREFAVPILLLGFARPDCRAHGPDEYFSLEDFRRAILVSSSLYEELNSFLGE